MLWLSQGVTQGVKIPMAAISALVGVEADAIRDNILHLMELLQLVQVIGVQVGIAESHRAGCTGGVQGFRDVSHHLAHRITGSVIGCALKDHTALIAALKRTRIELGRPLALLSIVLALLHR